MSRPKILLHDATTGESIEREMNDEEFAQWELDNENMKAFLVEQEAEAKAKAEAKASALAKLAALGLTEEEAKAIVG